MARDLSAGDDRGMAAPLLAKIAARIRAHGPLRFDAFQEMALYDAEHGYYETPGRIGREGDFVTGSSWHPAFARAIARIAGRVAEELGPMTVVDVGAGEGHLLRGLAEAFAGGSAVRLAGVERAEKRRGLAAAHGHVAASLEALAPVRGLVVAYELIDALPVRAFHLDETGSVLERFVTIDESGRLVFVERPCADSAPILARLVARGAELRPGQLFETRPGAAALAGELAEKLEAGLLLIFDYGAPARALYGPMRAQGTLESFVEHRVTRDVLTDPGLRDITAWVDFTELEHELSAAGLAVRGLVSQSRLLLAAGIAQELARDPDSRLEADAMAERSAIAKLFAPGGMGESIRVLVAERGTSIGSSLVRFPQP
jgi:SAM-dependent MidA family methyltransferase